MNGAQFLEALLPEWQAKLPPRLQSKVDGFIRERTPRVIEDLDAALRESQIPDHIQFFEGYAVRKILQDPKLLQLYRDTGDVMQVLRMVVYQAHFYKPKMYGHIKDVLDVDLEASPRRRAKVLDRVRQALDTALADGNVRASSEPSPEDEFVSAILPLLADTRAQKAFFAIGRNDGDSTLLDKIHTIVPQAYANYDHMEDSMLNMANDPALRADIFGRVRQRLMEEE